MPATRTAGQPAPSVAAAAAAFTALGRQPRSALWWIRPAHRYHATIAIAARVEDCVHELLAEQAAAAAFTTLPPFESVRACPKCGRNYEAEGPRTAFVPAGIRGDEPFPEYMACTCRCGYSWHELCADGLPPTEYEAAARSIVDEAINAAQAGATTWPGQHRGPFASLDTEPDDGWWRPSATTPHSWSDTYARPHDAPADAVAAELPGMLTGLHGQLRADGYIPTTQDGQPA